MREKILEALLQLQDETYREFQSRIVNNQTGNPLIGIRLPKLRAIAKEIAWGGYGDVFSWFKEIDILCGKDIKAVYQEEHMLYGMLIGMFEMWPANREHCMDDWIPRVMSWADCDTATGCWKFIKKDPDYWYPYFLKWLSAKQEFALRTAIVVLMQYYLNDSYIDRVIELYRREYSEAYYVRMGQAWALSACYVKYPEKTIALLKENSLSAWTQNKAIQKCRESLRVGKEEKEFLLTLKKER